MNEHLENQYAEYFISVDELELDTIEDKIPMEEDGLHITEEGAKIIVKNMGYTPKITTTENRNPRTPDVTVHHPVDKKYIGLIIGKEGKTVIAIKNKFQVQIDLDRGESNETPNFRITGSDSGIALAIEEINEMVSEAEKRDEGNRNQNQRGDRSQTRRFDPQQSRRDDSSQQRQGRERSRRINIPCRDFLKGKCHRGDECRYLHQTYQEQFQVDMSNDNWHQRSRSRSDRPRRRSNSEESSMTLNEEELKEAPKWARVMYKMGKRA